MSSLDTVKFEAEMFVILRTFSFEIRTLLSRAHITSDGFKRVFRGLCALSKYGIFVIKSDFVLTWARVVCFFTTQVDRN